VNDNLAGVCATRCGHLFIVVVVGAWVVTPSAVWLHALEVLVTGHRGHCVRIGDVVL
jgi:hypothetical protein